MTSVVFIQSDDIITGFKISGHANAGAYGEDIVCSAISSAAIMAVNTITEIIGAKADVEMREGYLSMLLKELAEKSVQEVLLGLELHLKQLSEQYPKNMTISYRR